MFAAVLVACGQKNNETMNKDFLKLATDRYSVRSFSPKAVGQEDIDKIVLAGRVAPTSLNSQPQKIYVVTSEEAMARVRNVSPCIYGAPQCIVACYDKTKASGRGEGDYGDIDVTIVLTHMMLEAADLGLGSCLVGRFDPDALREAIPLPENIVPVLLMPFGYPAEDAAPSPRHSSYRPEEETVEYL